MNAIKENASIVVLGKNIMPSFFNQIWLSENEIVSKDELSENIDKQIFAKQLSAISTNLFELLVLPQRIQLIPKSNDDKENSKIIERVVGKIVEKLPNIEYSAVGKNTTYLFEISKCEKYIEKCQKFFICSENTLVKEHFSTPDSKFGFYCSKDFNGVRLKLDVKPRKAKEEPFTDLIAMNFNFHFEVPENIGVDEKKCLIIKNISNWFESIDYSKRIVSDFDEMWSKE